MGITLSESIVMVLVFVAHIAVEARQANVSIDTFFETRYNKLKYYDRHGQKTRLEWKRAYEIVLELLAPHFITMSVFQKIIETFDRTNLYVEIENSTMMTDMISVVGLDALKRVYEEGRYSALAPEDPNDIPIPVVVGTAHYPTIALMNHSCDPNVEWRSADGTNKIQVYALRDIQQGEEIFISYIDQSLPKDERQRMLTDLYGFACTCARCSSNS
jgi:hypothetical protein